MCKAAKAAKEGNSSLVTLLEKNHVDKVAVIDDAFDVPTVADLLEDAKEDFWDEIQDNRDALTEVATVSGLQMRGPDDINDTLIEGLWSNREHLIIAKDLCDRFLFRRTNERLSHISPFLSLLEELKCTVVTGGRDGSLSSVDIKLVFLDYRLGPPGSADEIQMALDAVSRIHEQYDENKPVIVLMSVNRLSPDAVEEFRKRSKLLAGTFFFVPKDELRDKTSLYLKLWQLVTGLPFGSDIDGFVSAIKESLGNAADALMEGIGKLSLSDYAYIQKFSLQDEGQPLGDYLLWLYGSYFAHLLSNSEQVKRHCASLDKVDVDDLPLGQIDPSLQLKSFLSAAMFDLNIGPLSSHPRAAADQPGPPYLQLGDIFAKSPKENILMVINAQCDLVYSPGVSKRPFDENQTILFVQGRLHKICEQYDSKQVKTEFLEYNNELYRILWNPSLFTAIRYGEVEDCLRTDEYQRIARLRLPYALQVQQAFASNLTRVGVPVAPPIHRYMTATVYWKNEDSKPYQLLKSVPGECYFITTREGDSGAFTEEFVSKFRNEVERKVVEIRESIAASNVSGKKAEKLHERKKKLEEFHNDFSALLGLCRPFPIPKQGHAKLLSIPQIKWSREVKIDENNILDTLFLVHIVECENEENQTELSQ